MATPSAGRDDRSGAYPGAYSGAHAGTYAGAHAHAHAFHGWRHGHGLEPGHYVTPRRKDNLPNTEKNDIIVDVPKGMQAEIAMRTQFLRTGERKDNAEQ